MSDRVYDKLYFVFQNRREVCFVTNVFPVPFKFVTSIPYTRGRALEPPFGPRDDVIVNT